MRQPLGLWNQSPLQDVRYIYSPTLDRLYIRHNHIWLHFRQRLARTSHRHNEGRFEPIGDHNWLDTELPSDCQRASIQRQGHTVYRQSHGAHLNPTDLENPTSIQERILSLDILDLWTIDNCDFLSDEGCYLAKSISEGTCMAVSDGSYKEETKTATSAFLIVGPDKDIH